MQHYFKNISLYIDRNHLNEKIIKKVVIGYFSRMLKFPIQCIYRTIMYKCEMRQYRFMNYESKKFAESIRIKVLKTLHPQPVAYDGKMISS